MSYLNVQESHGCCDAFLRAMYGQETYERWHALKRKMNFYSESDFICWVLDIVEGADNMTDYADGAPHPDDKSCPSSAQIEFNDSVADETKYSATATEWEVSELFNNKPAAVDTSASVIDFEEVDDTTEREDVVPGTLSHSQPLLTPGSESKTAESLNRGNQSLHAGQPPEPGRESCDYCGKSTFTTPYALARHVNTVHLGEGKVECPVCGRVLQRRDHLKRHLNTHRQAGEIQAPRGHLVKGILIGMVFWRLS